MIETEKCPVGRAGHGIDDDIAHSGDNGLDREGTNARWIGHHGSAS